MRVIKSAAVYIINEFINCVYFRRRNCTKPEAIGSVERIYCLIQRLLKNHTSILIQYISSFFDKLIA